MPVITIIFQKAKTVDLHYKFGDSQQSPFSSFKQQS